MSDGAETPHLVPYIVRMGTYTQTGSIAQILPADASRLVLLLTLGAVTGSALAYLRSANSSGFKFCVMPGIYSEFSYAKFGDLVYESLWSDGSGAIGVISWMTLSRQ